MTPNATLPLPPGRHSRLGLAWVLLCIALALHVTDEALTNFLGVYNPTIIALRGRFPWWPMPVFTFRVWLSGLVIAIVLLLAVSPFVFRGARWMRPIAYIFAIIMLANGLSHTAGTIFGRGLVASVHFARPMPGFYSSPLLLAGSIYLLWQLRRTEPERQQVHAQDWTDI